MTDHERDEPDVAEEGDGDDHEVPAELTVLHEVLDWQAAQTAGPNEPTP